MQLKRIDFVIRADICTRDEFAKPNHFHTLAEICRTRILKCENFSFMQFCKRILQWPNELAMNIVIKTMWSRVSTYWCTSPVVRCSKYTTSLDTVSPYLKILYFVIIVTFQALDKTTLITRSRLNFFAEHCKIKL